MNVPLKCYVDEKIDEVMKMLFQQQEEINELKRKNTQLELTLTGLRKKPMSTRLSKRGKWESQEVQMALEAEKRVFSGYRVHIRFPDYEINDNNIRSLHSSINSINFINSKNPRFCTIIIDESADVEMVLKSLNSIEFMENRYLKADLIGKKVYGANDAEQINPYILYIGNIPMNPKVTSYCIKSWFKLAEKIDIGTNKNKRVKFATTYYKTVNDAITEFNRVYDMVVENQSLEVHFFRGNYGSNEDECEKLINATLSKISGSFTNGDGEKLNYEEQRFNSYSLLHTTPQMQPPLPPPLPPPPPPPPLPPSDSSQMVPSVVTVPSSTQLTHTSLTTQSSFPNQFSRPPPPLYSFNRNENDNNNKRQRQDDSSYSYSNISSDSNCGVTFNPYQNNDFGEKITIKTESESESESDDNAPNYLFGVPDNESDDDSVYD